MMSNYEPYYKIFCAIPTIAGGSTLLGGIIFAIVDCVNWITPIGSLGFFGFFIWLFIICFTALLTFLNLSTLLSPIILRTDAILAIKAKLYTPSVPATISTFSVSTAKPSTSTTTTEVAERGVITEETQETTIATEETQETTIATEETRETTIATEEKSSPRTPRPIPATQSVPVCPFCRTPMKGKLCPLCRYKKP